MNITINISDSSESQLTCLLTKVIECLQIEKANIVKEYENLKEEKAKSDGKFEELNKEYENLKEEKAKSDGKFEELNKEYENLKEEKAKSDDKFEELDKEYENLKEEKAKSDDKFEELDKLYKQERTNVFIESIKQVSLMLKVALNSDLDTKWAEYIKRIIGDIDEFVSEINTIDEIKLKIVSKNGWFSKLASIKWWSEATSVKDFLPSAFQNCSGFCHSFRNLQQKMKEFGVDIQIPSCDFSNKIENYKADYDEKTIVKELFPKYTPEQFVLCEINYISYNGNAGKCIGYEIN